MITYRYNTIQIHTDFLLKNGRIQSAYNLYTEYIVYRRCLRIQKMRVLFKLVINKIDKRGVFMSKEGRCKGRSIVFINKKGGVAKTTTVCTIAAFLSHQGKKVLIVDCDSQANSTTRFLTDEQIKDTPSLFDLLNLSLPWSKCIAKANEYENIAILPGSLELDDAGVVLKKVNRGLPQMALHESLRGITGYFDYIFFDCAPNTGILNQAALVAGDCYIIPTDCTTDGLAGADVIIEMANSLNRLRKSKYLGLLVCAYEKENSKHMQEFLTHLEDYKKNLIQTKIPATSHIPASGNAGLTIFDTHPKHKTAKAYEQVIRSVIM